MANEKNLPVYPLDKRRLGESAARALLESEAHPLPPEPFIGAGVYALYYAGTFPAYAALREINAEADTWPIYVGKAVPNGARKGGQGDSVSPGEVLYKRLKEHAESIQAAANLKLEDFRCRFLSVDDIWIPLTESLMIERFQPVWNVVLEGFGNHDPGRGRHSGQRPLWDCLHPGRKWADRLKPRDVTPEALEQRAQTYLREVLKDERPRGAQNKDKA